MIRGPLGRQYVVVDTTNFTDKKVFNPFICCRGASPNLHIVERYTRADASTIDYQYAVDDPATYTRPWTVSIPMTKTDGPIYEYACHEGNYGMLRPIAIPALCLAHGQDVNAFNRYKPG